MKREDTVASINRWMVRNDFIDIEYVGRPSRDAKRVNEFIKENLEWIRHKDSEMVDEYCHLVKENLCRGIEPGLKEYILKHAREYERFRK